MCEIQKIEMFAMFFLCFFISCRNKCKQKDSEQLNKVYSTMLTNWTEASCRLCCQPVTISNSIKISDEFYRMFVEVTSYEVRFNLICVTTKDFMLIATIYLVLAHEITRVFNINMH